MKTIIFKTLLILALTPAIAYCSTGIEKEVTGKYTKEKKISKKFNVSTNALLSIDNSYGNVDISSWDQNVVSIEVFIKTNGNEEEKVKEKLDDIRIEFNQSGNGVSAKTHFSREEKSFWNSLFGSSSQVNMEINYVIKVPVTNNVNISNDYGNINIDKLRGNAEISCDYGRIDIGELHGTNNMIEFDYSRNSHFNFINKAVINADYSDFIVDEANFVELQADYTNSHFKKVETLNFSCDYGSLTVDKLKKIVGNGDYLSTRIGQLFQSADLNIDYGNLEIDKIIEGAGDIEISSDYAGIELGYAKNHAFRFTVNTSYGNVKGLDNLQVTRKNQSNTEKSFSGYNIKESASGNIRINSNYAGITFKQK